MSDCNLDSVNMCCWTHGVDIDEGDYVEGYCSEGWFEAENECGDDDMYYPDEQEQPK